MNGAHVVVRDATIADVPTIHSFLEPFARSELILPRSQDDVRVLIRHGFVAEMEGRIVGFAALEIYSKKMAEIQSLAVSEEVRGQGVGTQLVQRCVARSKSEGVLELMAITSSESLFRSVGFDYSLPNQKRALFLQTREGGGS